MNGYELPMYRLEWRPDLTTNWVLISTHMNRADVDKEANKALDEWGGQARVVVQHVIEYKPANYGIAKAKGK